MYVFTERVTDVTAHGFLEFGQDSGMFNGNLGFKGGGRRWTSLERKIHPPLSFFSTCSQIYVSVLHSYD